MPHTLSFLMLLCFAVLSVASAMERRASLSSIPSKALMAAVAADSLAGTILIRLGLPGLIPLPWSQTLAIFAYVLVSCLVVNDALKVAMIRWCVPAPVA